MYVEKLHICSIICIRAKFPIALVRESVNRVLGSVTRIVLNGNVPKKLVIHFKSVTLCGLSKVFAGKNIGQIKSLTLMIQFDMKKILLLVKFLQESTCTVQKLQLYNFNRKGKFIGLPPQMRKVLFCELQKKKDKSDIIVNLYCSMTIPRIENYDLLSVHSWIFYSMLNAIQVIEFICSL